MRIKVMNGGVLAGRETFGECGPRLLAPCRAGHRGLFYVVPLRCQERFEPYEAEPLESLESLEARSVV